MIITSTSTFTRPANTTAYADNDLVANSTTAASVTPLTLSTKAAGGRGIIRGLRLYKSGATVTNASFTVHLFSADPGVPTNGDNGAFGVASASNHLDSVAIDLSSGAFVGTAGASKRSASLAIPFLLPAITDVIYALLQVEAAYTPASAEVFSLTAEIETA